MSRRIRASFVVASLLAISAAGLALAETGASGSTEAAKPAAATETAHHAKHHGAMMRVDLNSASKEQLEKVGIDDATADKIIAARPFKAKSELTSKNLLTVAEYKKVASHLMVKPVKS